MESLQEIHQHCYYEEHHSETGKKGDGVSRFTVDILQSSSAA